MASPSSPSALSTNRVNLRVLLGFGMVMALWLMNRTTPFGESLLAIVIRAISCAPRMAPPVAPVRCISNISLNSLGGIQDMIKLNMLQVHKTHQKYNIQQLNQYPIRACIAS